MKNYVLELSLECLFRKLGESGLDGWFIIGKFWQRGENNHEAMTELKRTSNEIDDLDYIWNK